MNAEHSEIAWPTVAIVGVGLLGGSIGLALQQRGLARQVIGIGRRVSSLRKAKRCGVVTHTTTNLAKGVADANLIVVCTPVGEIVRFVREAARHCPPDVLITDVGSTKCEIVESLGGDLGRGVTFVGSHPMAGSEKGGAEFARADLFLDRLTIVTPSRRSPAAAVQRTERFWQSLGSRTTRRTPQAHDAAVAATSHLPHLVASVLAAATPEDLLPLTATGWKDTTRVAAGDPELWRQIFQENRGPVLKSLERFEKLLATFRQALETEDSGKLTRVLEVGKQRRDGVGS